MHEIWKDIVGYEGFYQISNFGRVKSLERKDRNNHYRSEKLLSIRTDKLGYQRVHLSKDMVAQWHLVHRLVASAFVPTVEGCDIVNHIDNNPSNNMATNLEWTTYKGNMQWATKQGRMKGKPDNFIKASKNRRKPVVAISPNGERHTFESQKEAAESLGLKSAGHIAAACRKEYGYQTVGGYRWEYADQSYQASLKPNKVKMPDDVRIEKMRAFMKGNKYSLGVKTSDIKRKKLSEKQSKPILQFDKQGKFIARFTSAEEVVRQLKISHSDDVANGKRKSAGGYIWVWEDTKNETVK